MNFPKSHLMPRTFMIAALAMALWACASAPDVVESEGTAASTAAGTATAARLQQSIAWGARVAISSRGGRLSALLCSALLCDARCDAMRCDAILCNVWHLMSMPVPR